MPEESDRLVLQWQYVVIMSPSAETISLLERDVFADVATEVPSAVYVLSVSSCTVVFQ